MSSRTATLAMMALVVIVEACSPTAIASVLPIPSGPLVTVTWHGGECPEGMCESVVVIERDGRVHRVKPLAEDVGVVPANALAGLDTAVRTTNFDAIRARRFIGECPTAYDGQEVIYEFGAPGATQRVASCETEIDPDSPIFAAVGAAMQAVSVPIP